MQKYGVLESTAGDKQAGDSKTCPRCGQELRIEGPTRLCPTHGSAPFEQSAQHSQSGDDDDGA